MGVCSHCPLVVLQVSREQMSPSLQSALLVQQPATVA
jgi:hypothetical protein